RGRCSPSAFVRLWSLPQVGCGRAVGPGVGRHLSPPVATSASRPEIAIEDAGVESRVLPVEPVLRADRNARETNLHRERQQQGELRPEAGGSLVLKPGKEGQVKTTPVPLIGEGGVDESVAQHHLAPAQT